MVKLKIARYVFGPAFRVLFTVVLLSTFTRVAAQDKTINERAIRFPNIPDYKTLICDFHQHTVFSDGLVWPAIRVAEAAKDGLDAISITDHLEYQPHNNDIPNPDRNRPYELALKAAENTGLLVVGGSEITRDMPPGHANALFLSDANKLMGLDSMEVFREAKKQGAYVIWNHPHWIAQNPKGTSVLTKMHKQLIKEKLIQGIEIVNEHSYSDEALKIAWDNHLAVFGASDIHDLIDWQFQVAAGGHRPVTLVFSKEKTESAIRDALQNGRTAVWFDNTLVGKQEFLVPLIQQSLIIRKTEILKAYNGKSTVIEVSIENRSDADYIMENKSVFSFYDNTDVVVLKSNSVTNIQVKMLSLLNSFKLEFRVMNAITAPKTHPLISMNVYTAQN